MKTKDGVNYRPGMTVWFVCLGVVTEQPTREDMSELPNGYALGVKKGYIKIDGHYGVRDKAYVEAVNYWLKEKRKCDEALKSLNVERLAPLLATPATATSCPARSAAPT